MLNRLGRAAVLGVFLTTVLAAAPAHAADGGGECSGSDCDVWGGQDDDGGGGGGGEDSGNSGGCHYQGQTVPCTVDGLGWFNGGDGCYYLKLAVVPPLVGDLHTGEEGNWYSITCGMYGGGAVTNRLEWVPGAALNPPPNPEDLARRALASITLKGAAIRMAPRPGTAGLVNLPVWMWTAVTPSTWGPNTASASERGLTVTITARVEKIVWNMGDGHSVTCTSPGAMFTAGNGGKSSPTCGYTYTQASRNEAGGTYRVAATSYWRVDWAGGGVTGVIDQTRTASTTVRIDELQVVN